MAFDPSIIMGYRGMGELPNPMNQLAQVSQIQNAQNQNALAQYQLNAARRAEEGQTAIGQAYGKFYTNQPTGEAGQPAGQPSFGQMRQQIVQQLSTSAPHLIPGELAKIAAMEKEALQSKELQGKIDLQAPELQNRVSEQFKKQLVKVNDYDSAVQWLAAQYKNPVLAPIVGQEPFESAVKQIPKDPTAFQDWKNKNALGIEEYIKQNKPQLSTKDIGGSVVDRLFRPMSGEITEVSTTKKTPTFSDITGQGQLSLARAKFDFEKANPTMSIQEDANGMLAVNTRTGVATPIVYGPTGFQAAPAAAPGASMMRQPPAALPGQRISAIPGMASVLDQTAAPAAPAAMPMPNVEGARIAGQPVGSKKEAPAKFTETDMQLANLAGSVNSFRAEVAKNKNTSAKWLPTGEDTANMQAKYIALLMGVKDLYTLGALTGPDLSLIEAQITNPSSWAGKFTTKKGFEAQIKSVEDMIERGATNLENTYGRVPKGTRKALQSSPLGSSGGMSGATANDPLGLGIR